MSPTATGIGASILSMKAEFYRSMGMSSSPWFCATLCLGLSGLICPFAGAQVEYTVLEIPTAAPLGAFRAVDVNASGTVVGMTQLASGAPHVTVWTAQGGFRSLSTLSGSPIGEAYEINNSGQIAGWTHVTIAAGGGIHACRWESNGQPTDLGVIYGLTSKAYGLSESGTVVGDTYVAPGFYEFPWAFVYTDESGMQNLQTGPRSRGVGVNSSGTVIGERVNAETGNRAFLWDAVYGMRDIPLEPGATTYAHGINDSGIIVGQSQNTPYVWDPTIGVIFPAPGEYGTASDINAVGQVVGTAGGSPFIWDMARGTREINSLLATPLAGAQLQAVAISDSGLILVQSWDPGVGHRSYLLTPIPAPGCLALIALASPWLITRSRPSRTGASTDAFH